MIRWLALYNLTGTCLYANTMQYNFKTSIAVLMRKLREGALQMWMSDSKQMSFNV